MNTLNKNNIRIIINKKMSLCGACSIQAPVMVGGGKCKCKVKGACKKVKSKPKPKTKPKLKK